MSDSASGPPSPAPPTICPPAPAIGGAQKLSYAERKKQARDAVDMSKKRVLVLSSYVFPYHLWLYPEHVYVLFSPAENMIEDKSIERFYHRIEYFQDYQSSGLVEYKAHQLNKKYKFTHVIFQAEQDIIRAARIRAYLGLPGQSMRSALLFRDKVMMKQAIASHTDVLLPTFAGIHSAVDLVAFVEEHGLPVILKPTRGMGAVNTYAIRDQKQLETALARGVSSTVDGPVDMMVESFVTGQMYHVDGLVHQGTLKVIWPSCYVNDCVDFSSGAGGGFLGSYSLQPSNPLVGRLRAMCESVLSALEAPPSFVFHLEAWHTPDDTLVFCEVACRAGGAGVVPVLLELTEVNLNKFSMQTQCGDAATSPVDDAKAPSKCCGWMVMYPRIGTITAIPSVSSSPGVLSFNASATVGQSFAGIAHCCTEVASFVMQGADEEEVQRNIGLAAEWFEQASAWRTSL